MFASNARSVRMWHKLVAVAVLSAAMGAASASRAEASGPYDVQCTDDNRGCEPGADIHCVTSCLGDRCQCLSEVYPN